MCFLAASCSCLGSNTDACHRVFRRRWRQRSTNEHYRRDLANDDCGCHDHGAVNDNVNRNNHRGNDDNFNAADYRYRSVSGRDRGCGAWPGT